MKIEKLDFKTKFTQIKNLEDPIKNVLRPFDMQIRRSEATVLLSINNPGNQLLEADWDVFELILFNFVQNAVKYNSKKGVIVVLADVKTN